MSVIMSCYNGSRWLQEAIDSVLTQSFQNFELILVDDGSSDGTLKIIEENCCKDPRIFCISKTNTGLADSLNVGISMARGLFIARLDQDDLCEPERLEEQVAYMHDHPETVLLGTGFFEIDEYGNSVKQHNYPVSHHMLVWHLEHLMRFFPHSSAIYRAYAIRKVGGYNVRISRAEDWRLWLEFSLSGQVACLPRPLVRIRRHSAQMSNDLQGRRQYYDAVAATICHELKKMDEFDPSVDFCAEEWADFLLWVEVMVDKSLVLERREAWSATRSIYHKKNFCFVSAFRLINIEFFFRHALGIVNEKLLGSSLPQRLAKQWLAMGIATSPS